METFALLIEGGDSGRILLPGNVEGSRLFRLVGAREQPRMPQGQARIKRKWFYDLQTWIKEGLKYDADDPQIPLRQLVPTDEEKRAMELAAMTPDEFAQLREARTAEQFKRVAPRDRALFAKSKEVYVYGNASDSRLKEIGNWAEEHAKTLRTVFGVNDDLIWKGKLAIVVFKDRFGYTEFHQVIHRREVPREVIGHSVVTATFEDAYIVLQDVGDEADEQAAGLKVNLIDHMTGAFLKRGGVRLPDWVIRGTGIALAVSKSGADKPFVRALRENAIDALKDLQKPEDVFVDGKFSPADIGAVGYTLVDYMMSVRGGQRFGRFIQALQKGASVNAAVKSVYAPSDTWALARSYGARLLNSQPKGKRKKR